MSSLIGLRGSEPKRGGGACARRPPLGTKLGVLLLFFALFLILLLAGLVRSIG